MCQQNGSQGNPDISGKCPGHKVECRAKVGGQAGVKGILAFTIDTRLCMYISQSLLA